MDRHKIPSNRHRNKETFKSGSSKRKIAKEREKKNEEVLSKSRRMTDFVVKSVPTSSITAENDGTVNVDATSDAQALKCNSDGPSYSSQPEPLTEGCEMDPDSNATNMQSRLEDIITPQPGTSQTEISAFIEHGTENGSELLPPHNTNVDGEISTDLLVGTNLEEAQKNTLTSKKNVFSENDIGLWPDVLSPSDIDQCLKIDIMELQNCNSDLLDSNSKTQYDTGKGSEKGFIRKCKASFFVRKTRNGETIHRSWLCFSPTDGHVYCSVCKLFSPARSQFTHGGFCDWKNAMARLIDHETSRNHLNAVIDYTGRTKQIGQIDQKLKRQAEDIANYWREVLKRLIDVIAFLSERGLAFRGENETLGSPHNGNYLGILELLARYDPFLKDHIETHGNCGSGHTNYLSSTICEEVLQIISKQVFDEIMSRIKKSKYYSISVDSTLDEGHVDQLTLVIRYLEDSTPVERFVRFMPNQGHKAKEMFQGLNQFLKENHLDIKHCRGQSYDNASSMSGKYNGLQALVQEENNLAAWIPCAAHSLNLVLQAAAGCCLNAVSFFDFLEEIFVYFTASSNRFEILTNSLKKADNQNILVPKRVSTTRWSCRADATKALLQGYKETRQALVEISKDKDDSGKSRIVALGLIQKLDKFETAFYTVFWDDILGQVNKTSVLLQSPKLDFNTASAMVSALKDFIQSKRDCFKEYEEKAIQLTLTDSREYESELKRHRKINVRLAPLDCVQAPEVTLSPSDAFRTGSFIPVIDQFESELSKRLQAYSLLNTRFGFLNKMENISNDEIVAASKLLVATYNHDLDDQLSNELIQFKSFALQFQSEYEALIKLNSNASKENWMYKLILDNNLRECFPNVETLLRMYLSLMVTNCSAERSFSKLKLIKNRLRTSMLEERLNFLALLSMENDVLRQINYEETINTFVDEKVRRKPIAKK